MTIKRADWVRCILTGAIGCVNRVAGDGSWADVKWHAGQSEWTKRMRPEALEILTTIPFGGGTVTDLTRQAELSADNVAADRGLLAEHQSTDRGTR